MAVTSEFSPFAGIGAAVAPVGTAVGNGKVRVLIGLRITNGKLDQPITASVYIRRGGQDYPFVPGALVPAGGSIEGLASSKFVMIAGDQIVAKSSVDASLFVFPSFDEDVP